MFQFSSGAELASKLEVVLGAKADYLDDVVILSRKLRDIRSFSPTGRSMRREEPEQNWSVAVNGLGKGCHLAAGNVEHLDVENRAARVEFGAVCFACLDDGRCCWVGCNGSAASAGSEQEGKSQTDTNLTDGPGLGCVLHSHLSSIGDRRQRAVSVTEFLLIVDKCFGA